MRLKKLLKFIPDVSTTRVIRESRGLYGRTYKVLFEGQCEKIPYWLVDFDVLRIRCGGSRLVVEVYEEWKND